MADTTLPGTTPALLRRCSSIIVTDGPYTGRRGVLAWDPGEHPRVLVLLDVDGDEVLVVLTLDRIALDLANPTSLVHALWWLVALPPDTVPDAMKALGLDQSATESALGCIVTGTVTVDSDVAILHRLCAYIAGKLNGGPRG